jgi:archaellum component FlaG (FlaF/FlaG flagellin family)
VVGKDGTPVLAGSWLVSAQGAAIGTTLNGSALIDPGQVASVQVVNTAGKQYASVVV